jgi:hypothetical protein
MLAKIARWEKYDQQRKRWVRTDPPMLVARTILSRRGHWPFAQLTDLIGSREVPR